MKIVNNPIVITTLDGKATVVRPQPEQSVGDIMEEVFAAIVELYEQSDVVLEEFIECGELQIDGLPLQLQVELFTRLKEEIDGDKIYIEAFEGAFPTMKLNDYLILGPTNGQEEPKHG